MVHLVGHARTQRQCRCGPDLRRLAPGAGICKRRRIIRRHRRVRDFALQRIRTGCSGDRCRRSFIGRARTFLALFILQLRLSLRSTQRTIFVCCYFPLPSSRYVTAAGSAPCPLSRPTRLAPGAAATGGTIYGVMLTAWSVGACVGPLLIAAIPYRTALPLIALMLAVSALLPPLFRSSGPPQRPGLGTRRALSGVRTGACKKPVAARDTLGEA